jgi:Phosphoenolpyruvate carboxylase
MPKPKAVEAEDKDLPLRHDIRLFGRILGDTVREQSGEAVFDTVEHIRQNSVRFRRDEDVTARRDLEATLNSLPPTEALQIIRAFGFFPSRQYSRGPAPHPPHPRSSPDRLGASRRHDDLNEEANITVNSRSRVAVLSS